MDGLLTLYVNEMKKINLKRRYKIFTSIVLLIVIVGGVVCWLPRIGLRPELYPYIILTITNYFFAPVAVVMLAVDIIPPKIGKCLVLASIIVILFLFKIFLSVFMASSILSVVLSGIDSISLANVMKAYICNFPLVIAVATIAVFAAAVIKSKMKGRGNDER